MPPDRHHSEGPFGLDPNGSGGAAPMCTFLAIGLNQGAVPTGHPVTGDAAAMAISGYPADGANSYFIFNTTTPWGGTSVL